MKMEYVDVDGVPTARLRDDSIPMPMTEEEITDVQKLVREIGTQEARGYLVVVKILDEKDEKDGKMVTTQTMGKVSNCDRITILETVFEATGLTPLEHVLLYLLNKLRDKNK